MEGVDWSSAEAIGRLRIGDFACGTGALLSAVYDQVAARHERAGGDAAALHRVMMEQVLYGCDVMPSAVHSLRLSDGCSNAYLTTYRLCSVVNLFQTRLGSGDRSIRPSGPWSRYLLFHR